MTAKIQRIPLQHEIISYIKNYINDNDLKAGDRLPSQSEMIEMMGVSRTALREAIKTLEAKGILEVKNGKGVYVKEDFKDTLLSQLSFAKEKESLVQLLEVRSALEREMLRLIVQNSTEEELEKLGNIVKVLMDKYNQGERQNKEDRQFHETLYGLCHHEIFQHLMQSLSDKMDQLWEFPLHMESPFTATIPLHKDLYDALCQRNLKKAREINKKIISMMIKDIKAQT